MMGLPMNQPVEAICHQVSDDAQMAKVTKMAANFWKEHVW